VIDFTNPPKCQCGSKVVGPLARPDHAEGDAWVCCSCGNEWPMESAIERLAHLLPSTAGEA
jgi:hypothetical protein